MHNKPTNVSVVIPAYNSAVFLPEALDSVFAQTRPPAEVIVVDDGSTDDTSKVLEMYGDRVIVVAQENRGLSGARNRGMDRATAEWVAFLDADDTWEPEKLERQLDAVDASDVVCVHTNFARFGEVVGVHPPAPAFLEGRHDVDTLISGQGWVCPSSAMVRRSTSVRFEPWAPPAEDVIFFSELTFRGAFRYVPEPLVGHRIHPGQATRQAEAVRRGTIAELRWIQQLSPQHHDHVEAVFFDTLVTAVERAKTEARWRYYQEWRRWLRAEWPDRLHRPAIIDERPPPSLIARSGVRLARRVGERVFARSG